MHKNKKEQAERDREGKGKRKKINNERKQGISDFFQYAELNSQQFSPSTVHFKTSDKRHMLCMFYIQQEVFIDVQPTNDPQEL